MFCGIGCTAFVKELLSPERYSIAIWLIMSIKKDQVKTWSQIKRGCVYVVFYDYLLDALHSKLLRQR
jgi:hypothetical protein